MAGSDKILLEITPQVLLKAYACGIFPMADSANDPGLFWIEPETRGVIPLQQLHLSRSLRKTIRKNAFDILVDNDFDAVISACAQRTASRKKTWINNRIRLLYRDLFDMGHCHTVEAWQDGKLVGGLYGVVLGSAFFGESMFSTQTDASKVALTYLVHRLNHGGFTLLDTQFTTSHLKSLGAMDVPREEYDEMLSAAIAQEAHFYPKDYPFDRCVLFDDETEDDQLLGGATSDSILQFFSHTS